MTNSIEAKGLAYILCRELIEDAHAEYKISDEEMKRMKKKMASCGGIILP